MALTLYILQPYAGPQPEPVCRAAHLTYVGNSDTDYAQVIHELWTTPVDLIVIEHDVHPPLDRLLDLASRRMPSAVPYLLYPAHTALREPVWSAMIPRWSAMSPGPSEYPNLRFVDTGEFYASRVGLGCTFVPYTHKARHTPLPAPLPHWKWVDRWVCDKVLSAEQRDLTYPTPWRLLWDPACSTMHDIPTTPHPEG